MKHDRISQLRWHGEQSSSSLDEEDRGPMTSGDVRRLFSLSLALWVMVVLSGWSFYVLCRAIAWVLKLSTYHQ